MNIEHGKLNGVTLIDFRKASDMINVHILVSKLQCYHFDEVLIKWMYSYLTGRFQCVQVKNYLSSPAPIYLMVYHKEVFSDHSYLSCLLMISIYTAT